MCHVIPLACESGFTGAKPNNKRFLILTYTVEFDRVHYPLSLVSQGKAESSGLIGRYLRAHLQVDHFIRDFKKKY